LFLQNHPNVDPNKIGLYGGSYGGYLTAMGLAKASNMFAAGVDIHGVYDWNNVIQNFIPSYNRLEDPEFTVKNCLTYHDIGRFSHEKAVRILIDLNISSRRFRGVESRELKLNIPLGLHVIDLGGGLDTDDRGNKIESLERIKSLPMKSMLLGLVAPGAWSTQPLQLGFSDLVSSLTRFSMTARGASYQGQNLAVISDNYANISLRLGYHFNVIDTYVSENVDDNYIYFRFVGGVTETERRHLRAMLIKVILEKLNFRVTLSGDLVVARLKKVEKHRALDVLREIGRLIGFTRQLDTQMQSEQSIAELSQAFFQPPHEAM